MKVRLERPWILFPYKSPKKISSYFETFTAMTLKLQEVANLGMFFCVMQASHSLYSCLCTIKIRTHL